MKEIAADYVHPGNGISIKNLLKHVGSLDGVHRWGEANEIWEGKTCLKSQ